MADKKISQLTAATTPLAGTEVLPIVQSSTTVKATIADIQAAPVSAGTASTIPYLNASKVPTSGLALRFDGTNLGIGTSTTFYSSRLSVNGHISAAAGNSLKLWNAADNNLATLTGTGAAELSIAAAGGVKLTDGNLNFATAGRGVIFSGNSSVIWRCGSGSPEGVVTAPVGSLFTQTDGGANTTLYVKESGAGNTGWIAK